MENNEIILKSFKQGKSIKGIIDTLYYSEKGKESCKKRTKEPKLIGKNCKG